MGNIPMPTRGVTLLIISAIGTSLAAQSIEGTVVIKETQRSAGSRRPYRFTGARSRRRTDADADADPLMPERSRVAIYLEDIPGRNRR